MIRVLLIPSSDYLGHPFPQRYNHLFERVHDGKDFEVHVIRFDIYGKKKLETKCIIHEIPLELKTRKTAHYYLMNAPSYANEILKIVRQESIDAVVYENILPPLLFELTQALTQRKIPTIFDIQDYYPTSATGYIAKPNSFIGKTLEGFFKIMVDYLIKQATAVTTPGAALALYAKKTAPGKPIYIIPNGISEHFLDVYIGEGIKLRERLGFDQDDLVVGYIGSVEFWLDMEPLIKAIAEVNKRGKNAKLLIVGRQLQSKYGEAVSRWLKSYGVDRYTQWLDFVPHKEVPMYAAAIDLGTIPFDVHNPTAYYAAPNKMWEYLSQGTEVVATPIPEALLHRKIVKIAATWEQYAKVMLESPINTPLQRLEKTKRIGHILKERTWERSAQKVKRLIATLVRGDA